MKSAEKRDFAIMNPHRKGLQILSKVAGIILAAGKGTRMNSPLPKVLHRVCGVPMVSLVGQAMRDAGVICPVVVYGHGGDQVLWSLGKDYNFVLQAEQKGTGHATLVALTALAGFEGPVLIAPGDTPLLTSKAFREMLTVSAGFDCVVGTMRIDNPNGYGRVVRDSMGVPIKIVEELDATDEERSISEVNTSIYCFDSSMLNKLLPTLKPNNAKGEIYLTDLVAEIIAFGGKTVAYEFEDPSEVLGVNDQLQLAEAGVLLRARILRSHAVAGVTFVDPSSTFIGPHVRIGEGTIIEPMTMLEGECSIGKRCNIGPMTKISNSEIGDEVQILMSHVNRAKVGNECRVGPYANLRPKTVLFEKSRIGNFVEVKNSEIGCGTSVSHLTYIGDAEIGENSNIGAGTITCNYDGFEKHRTEIGSNTFIGSNSTLVAPLKIGDGTMTAAGSVITTDVPDDSLAVGRARQENKDGWAKRWRQGKKQKTE